MGEGNKIELWTVTGRHSLHFWGPGVLTVIQLSEVRPSPHVSAGSDSVVFIPIGSVMSSGNRGSGDINHPTGRGGGSTALRAVNELPSIPMRWEEERKNTTTKTEASRGHAMGTNERRNPKKTTTKNRSSGRWEALLSLPDAQRVEGGRRRFRARRIASAHRRRNGRRFDVTFHHHFAALRPSLHVRIRWVTAHFGGQESQEFKVRQAKGGGKKRDRHKAGHNRKTLLEIPSSDKREKKRIVDEKKTGNGKWNWNAKHRTRTKRSPSVCWLSREREGIEFKFPRHRSKKNKKEGDG